MIDPSQLRPSPQPAGSVEIRRAVRPSPELGRFLYTAAGGNWYWIDRLAWTYGQWLQRLSHARVETWVGYLDGTPAAYFELDGATEGEVEIAYLGVLPAFIGHGLGGWLLTEAIRRAWAMGADRVWVHTCTLDASQALANYQARGMRVFNERVEPVELPDPRTVLTGAPGPATGRQDLKRNMPMSCAASASLTQYRVLSQSAPLGSCR